MCENIIMLGSVTHALKARDILTSHGIYSTVIRTPKALNKCGCGYSVSIQTDAEKATEILRNAGLKILGKV